MFADWLLACAPIVGLGLDVIVQVIVAHALRALGRAIIAGFLLGFAATLAIVAAVTHDPAAFVLAAITYGALGFCYWAFLNLNITSLRIRVLREMLAERRMSRAELSRRYSSDEFLRRRLDRLEQGAQARVTGETWVLTSPSLAAVSWIIRAARWVVLPVRAHPRV